MKEFRINFHRGRGFEKQWIKIIIWDVHPNTFQNWGGGRWAYFEPKWDSPKSGFFGELHLVESGIREDTVVHELLHVVLGWCFANWIIPTPKNEEKICEFMDELTRKFYFRYKKLVRKEK